MANELFIPSDLSTTVLSTTLAEYGNVLTDNIYNANVLLGILKNNKKIVDGGGSIVEPIIKEEQDNGGFYLGADVLNTTQSHTTTLVEFRWQNLYEPIVINRDEERSNSGSSHKIVDLVRTKIMLSEKAMAKRLEQALSTPVAEANNLIDLETLVNTGTLGTINGTTDTFWQSTVTASGTFATQGLTDMTTATYAVSSSSSDDLPTHYITTSSIFQAFEATRLPVVRYSDTATANAGFQNLLFKTKPVVYGNYIGSGLMFGINTNYLMLNVDSESDFITTDFVQSHNQTLKAAYIIWRGNLITNNRRRMFKLTGIS
jgi:hypothetical protein